MGNLHLILNNVELDLQDITNETEFLHIQFMTLKVCMDQEYIYVLNLYHINHTHTNICFCSKSWENLPSEYTEQSLFTADISSELFQNIRNTIDNIDNSNNDIKDSDDAEDGIENIVKAEITENVPDATEIPITKKNAIKPIQRLIP